MLRSSLITLILLLTCIACRKNTVDSVHPLTFSTDTVYFDTVFSSVGSTTRELLIKNNERHRITLDEISLSGGAGSQFRLNIDGEPGYLKKNVQIGEGDSIYLFITAYIDPQSNDSPVAVTDSLIFTTGSISSKVQLLAWGQDIHLMKNSILSSAEWKNDKPYVLYGSVFVDTLQTLQIDSGARIFFHRSASLTVAGTLKATGTVGSPVIFSGDRLEKMYEDIPGQWNGITFLDISSGNILDHAIIRNSVNGLTVGLPSQSANYPDLDLLNSSVMHSTVACLSANHGKVTAANSVFSHSGRYCLSLNGGGAYRFIHCTFFNVWDYGFRQTPAVAVNEKKAGAGLVSLEIGNCAVYGDLQNELDLSAAGSSLSGSYLIDHCLLRLDSASAGFWNSSRFRSVLLNRNPRFISASDYDLRPDTLSPLIDAGSQVYSSEYPFDIRGRSRIIDGKPDIGAFERIRGEHKP
jgi:hypothetical protein